MWNRLGSAFERPDIGIAGEAGVRRAAWRRRRGAADGFALRAGQGSRGTAGDDIPAPRSRFAPGDRLQRDLPAPLHRDQRQTGRARKRWRNSCANFHPKRACTGSRSCWARAVGQHVSVEQFLGLDREFAAEKLAETDPFEKSSTRPWRLCTRSSCTAAGSARRHPRKPAAPVPGADTSALPQASKLAGPCLRLAIQGCQAGGTGKRERQADDRNRTFSRRYWDPRCTRMSKFPGTTYPPGTAPCIGRAGNCGWPDHSTNGTWVDGERVRRGSRVALANGAMLGFGRDQGDADHDRYPAIHALLPGSAAVPAQTSPRLRRRARRRLRRPSRDRI